ncbi:MAG: hypothetical protein ACHQFZ_08545 [Acidimicrobiales bacterium]
MSRRPVELTGRSASSWRWRGAYFVTLGAATAALVAGIAYGALTATGSGGGSASTGSVALSINAPATTTCNYPKLTPGDLAGAATCALSVTYGGSLTAYVSLTVAVQSKSGVGGHPLFDGVGDGLTFTISDGHHSFSVPAGAGTTGGTCPVGFTCWTSPYDLAAWYSGVTANLAFTNASPAVTWTVTPSFPTTLVNANGYQGATANVILTAQAVQGAPANPLPATCTTSTIGQSCPASGGFAWS